MSQSLVLAFVPALPFSIIAFEVICLAILSAFLAATWTSAASRQHAIRGTAWLAVGRSIVY
ncbi:MAG: hypothetical protein R3C53_27600 [Pirellulaceae bacterium]